jgi:hypothetical protein
MPLRTALGNTYVFNTGPHQAAAFSTAHAAGASYVLLIAHWNQIAPAQPDSNFNASDPDSPGYNWNALDQQVTAAKAGGLTPIMEVIYAPSWAEAVPRSGVNSGSPKIAALGKFAHAIATHYDGKHGAPAVHVFLVWNEPNLSVYLTPPSATLYRKMVNAFAAAAHRVSHRNVVVAGGLDPFKNHTKRWHTIAPLAFMRQLLCVSRGMHPRATCKARTHFDVWSHHPYTFGGPRGLPRLKDDVTLGNLSSMTAVLRSAGRLHHIVSAHKPQFWVTEFCWDTTPPAPHAMPLNLQARATAEALHQMWLSGVSLATWLMLQDSAKWPAQCGLYFAGDPIDSAKAKPTLTAFRFPFVAYRRPGGVSIWGRDATSNSRLVTIQLRHGHKRWRTVARVRSNRYGIFVANLSLHALKTDWMRASAQGSKTSLAFSLRQPKYPHIGPWG